MNEPRAPRGPRPGAVRRQTTPPHVRPAGPRRGTTSAKVAPARRRARSAFFAFFVVTTIFFAQLLRMQVFDAGSLAKSALAQRMQPTEIPAGRGTITSADGQVLARSVERIDVVADSVDIAAFKGSIKRHIAKGIPGISSAIANILGGDPQTFVDILTKAHARKSRFTYLTRDITPAQWSQISALELPGITSESVQRREYPQGTDMASLIGWVNNAGVPGGGIEQSLNSVLAGKDGLHRIERALDGTMIATANNEDIEPVAGRDVQLTIDSNLQWYAQNELTQQVKAVKGQSGEIVISDRSGNLLATASYPSFDNNDMTTANVADLQNRAFTSSFEPGSTQKMVTIGSVLQQGVMKPTDHVEVPSTLTRAGRPFKDAETHGTEYLTLAGVIAKSSNMGTILAGERISKDSLYATMQKFGLGQSPGTGYPAESAGLVYKPSQWKGDAWYTMMFGQGLASSPIQQVNEFQAIANGGVREPLKLISSVANENGTMQPYTDSRKPVQVFSSNVSQELIGMMEGVVSKDGSAPKAAVPGYQVAGKTSTAQMFNRTLGKYDGVSAGFIGMAPANNPQLIISVNIQKPQKGEFGGDIAGPVFSKVMSYALAERHIPPSGVTKLPYPITYKPEESDSK